MACVLILDDEPAVCKALALCVTMSGHQAEVSEGPHEALERLASAPFDLLITDYRMAGMTGLELVRRLRARRSRIPVILITASVHDISRDDVTEAAISAVLGKPFDLAQFRRVFLPLVAPCGANLDLVRASLPLDPQN